MKIKSVTGYTALFIFLLLGLFASPGLAQDSSGADAELDNILGGFDEEPAGEEAEIEPEPVEKSAWTLSGAVTLGASYNYAHEEPDGGATDYRGLSRLRLKGSLELDVDIAEGWKGKIGAAGFHDFAYEINGRDEYTDQVLDKYESELKIKEAYIQGNLNRNTDLKVGRQIIVWGKSDDIRITDVLNPLDLRQPGMVDIEDLREPITMIRLDYYFDKWSLTGVAIGEARYNNNPVFGSDYYPGAAPAPEDVKPSSNISDAEYAFALNGVFTGYDLSFYFARIFDDKSHLAIDTSTGALKFNHARITMLGVAANMALGSWIVKAEAAYFEGLEFNLTPGLKKSRLDSLVGVEYSGIPNNTFSFEYASRRISGFDSRLKAMGVMENEYEMAFRYMGDFLNNTLHPLVVVSLRGAGGEDGAFGRLSLKYDVNDSLAATTGLVWYASGDSPLFKAISDNDRLFLDLKYSF